MADHHMADTVGNPTQQGAPAGQNPTPSPVPTMAEMVAEIIDLREQNNRMRAQTDELSDLLRQVSDQLPQLARQTPPVPPPAPAPAPASAPAPTVDNNNLRPRGRYPDVSQFSGESPAEYLPFKMNLRTKLTLDVATFPTDQEQVLYSYTRLAGKAARRMLPWIQAQENRGAPLRMDGFLEAMDKAFGDPHLVEKALARVNTMRQGNKELREFLGEFDEALAQAGGLGWEDGQKKMRLRTALDVDLLSDTVGMEAAPSYEGYCNQLLRIDEQRKEVARLRSHKTRGGVAPPPPGKDPDEMDWQATVASLTAEVAALRANTRGGTSTGRSSWASREEIERRKSEGLCLRCGRRGHYVRECRARLAQRPATIAPSKIEEQGKGRPSYEVACEEDK